MANYFQSLRVRAYLQTGVISDQYLPLDGVLYYHAVREKYGEQVATRPLKSTVPEWGKVVLPFLKKSKQSNSWFYACSFAQWPEHTVEASQTYSKRFDTKYSDVIDFKGKVGKIPTSRGRFKNYHIKEYYRHALWVDWYALANKEELEKLLQFCTHLGKKTSQGFGSVLRWELTEWPEDWSVRGPQNKVMRAIPIPRQGFLYGVRPSYWNPKHQFNCLMP